jgi:RNA polymerase sigma-70 factor (ECF subfamily)
VLSRRPHTELTDLELIKQYKLDGENEWIGILFSRYTSLVYGVCVKYLKNRDEAKDAVMQLFEKLLTTLKEHEVEHFKSWLYITARNHCLMKLRAQKGKYTEEISPFIMETSAEVHLEEQQLLESNLSKLENCIEKLGYEQKDCVKLFYLQEKCYQEVSEITGFEMSKVKSYIQNGKRNLKICMEENE